MGVLLFCLAIAMIVGGSAAVYSGSLIISIERGWSMMIAGSVCASGGAIVLGLAVLAGRLRRISRQTETLDETMSRIEMTTWGPPPPLVTDDVEVARPVAQEPEPIVQAVERPDRDMPPVAPGPGPVIAPPIRPMDTVPSVMAAPAPAGDVAPVEVTRVEALASNEPTVVGSYSAGDNAYLMYSDGSIQADTPEGRFRFDSLDELKTYVADVERKNQASPPSDPPPQVQTSPETADIAKA